MLTCLVPSLIDHLSDASSSDALLAVLVNIAKVSPASLSPFLPALRTVGQQTPGLLGHVAKIYGAVGLTSEVSTRYLHTPFFLNLETNTRILSAVIERALVRHEMSEIQHKCTFLLSFDMPHSAH